MLKFTYDPKVHLLWAIPLFLWIVEFAVGTKVQMIGFQWFTVIALVIGIMIYNGGFKTRRKYEALVTRWNAAVQNSDPLLEIKPAFDTRDGETIYYSMTSQRYAERLVRQDIQTTTGGGLGAAVVGGLAFGAAGAVAGSVIGKKSTKGTATNVYNVVLVDTGILTVTDQRFLFLGARHTVILQRADVLRSSSPQPEFLVLEYQGRPAGEMFTVESWTYPMSMVRRAGSSQYALPAWPWPAVVDPPTGMPLPRRVDGVLPGATHSGRTTCAICSTPIGDSAVKCWKCGTDFQAPKLGDSLLR